MDAIKKRHPRFIDLTGQTFGALSVVSQAGNRRTGESTWDCVCQCGARTVVPSSKLRSGSTSSCGCAHFERHGRTRTPEYQSWAAMRRRCSDPTNADYERYGRRGIKVCERWENSFSAFFEDMGERPTPQHSLDRIDLDGDYCPGNCRWATPLQQSNNRSTNVVIEFNGKRMTAAEWARLLGFGDEIVSKRLRRGWSIKQALTTPLRAPRPRKAAVNGE